MELLDAGRKWLRDKTTPAVVWATLRAMALAFRTVPSLRRHLAHRHPVTGTPFAFRARFQFSTRDGATHLHAVFADGRMHVGTGRVDRPDVTARFRDLDVMRAFFTPGADLFAFLLRNELAFEGNLSYLAKFGHMSTALQLRGRQKVGVGKVREERGVRGVRGAGQEHPLPSGRAGERCRERPEGEVRFLEDPYLSAYTLDDFPRAARLLDAHRTVPPEMCTERPRLLTEFLLRERERGATDPPALRQGKALRHILFHKQALVRDDDLFLGTTTSKRVGVVVYPECGGTSMWPELLTMASRELNPYRISDEDVEVLDREVFPFWMDQNVREWARRKEGDPLALRLDERFVLYFLWKNHAVSHTIADLPLVLSRGLLDLREEALRCERSAADESPRAFHQAVRVAIDGVLDYADRLADRALAEADRLAAAADPGAAERGAELREMARIARQVPARPAGSLREALQSVWLVFLCLHQESTNAGLSVGRLDTWLEPFFRRDLESVTDPAERERRVREALELVCAFLLKFTDHLPMVPDIGNRLFGGSSSDQVITLGGVTPDGRSAVADMTWLFLKATELLRLRDPNMNARYAPGVNSKAYLRRLCEVNLLTRATPSLHNDQAVVQSLVEQGFALEHARDWGATGCVEPTICGRHFGHTNCMMFNLVAPLEMALRDGVHPVVGPERLGPSTGDPRAFRTFEDFVAAYERQLAWLIDMSVEGNEILGRAHQALRPTPLLSSLFEGPLASGRDLIDGGARYNSSGTAMIGLTDVIDSLSAIRTLVFDRRTVDFDTLLRALDADFAGHEALLAEIRGRVPRFGQDDPLPGELTARVQRFVFDRYQEKRNYRGGRYLPGYWSMSNHVAFGTLSGALPSGRLRGQAFTPGLTPAPLCGAPLTEQMRAVAALDSRVMPNNLAFNVKLAPGGHDTHDQLLGRLTAYADAYFGLGGMQIQFNVVSTATLRDAVAHPDRYRDLLVRISGYNAYFVELNADMQRELIERMEHSLGS